MDIVTGLVALVILLFVGQIVFVALRAAGIAVRDLFARRVPPAPRRIPDWFDEP